MRKEFSAITKTADGTAAPILLVGGKPGSGKETVFIEKMKESLPLKSIVRFEPYNLAPQDVDSGFANSIIDDKLWNALHGSAGSGGVVALFSEIHLAHPDVIAGIAQKINNNKSEDVIFILSCPEPSDLPSDLLGSLKDLRVVQFDSGTHRPVMDEPVYDVSPLHSYRDAAINLSFLNRALEGSHAQEQLDYLTSLLDVTKTLEGGLLGQEAYDRGMDSSVIKGLLDFAKAHKESQNPQALSISASIVEQAMTRRPQSKYFENQPDVKKSAADGPALG
jgi:hypothetical protein